MLHWTRPHRTIALALIATLGAMPAQAAAPAASTNGPRAAVSTPQPTPTSVSTSSMPPVAAPPVPPIPAVLRPLGGWLWVLRANARRYDLPPSLVEAVALVESHGDAAAVSSAGAVGLMQVTPLGAAQVGLPIATSAEQLQAGVAVLAWDAAHFAVSADCLGEGPGGSAGCAWRTDRAVSGYYAGAWGTYAAGYVAAVRSVWVRTKGAMAAGEAGADSPGAVVLPLRAPVP